MCHLKDLTENVNLMLALSSDAVSVYFRSMLTFVLENSLLVIMSQAVRYLKDPALSLRDKQLLKRELGAELVSRFTLISV